MKSFFVLCAVIALTFGWDLPAERGRQVNVVFNQCLSESRLSINHIGKIYRFEYPDTDDVHHFLKCVFESLLLWDDESGVQSDFIGDILHGHEKRDEILKEVEECNSNWKSDDSDKWLYDAVVCVMNRKVSDEVKDILKRAIQID